MSAAEIPFVKMHGLGNDYVYLDEREVEVGDPVTWARVLSHRHRGIGSDGLIILRRDPDYPCRMEMYNADGSRAEMCGNGLRCVARLAWERGYTQERRFTLATDSGDRQAEILDGVAPHAVEVRVSMGRPEIEELEVRVEARVPAAEGEELRAFSGSILSVGNPHFVIETEIAVARVPVERFGPPLEIHPRFPHRANIGFAHVRDGEVDLRVWERGSGETQACGTGATAAVAALHHRGRLGSSARVNLRGGALTIEIDGEGEAWMRGSADHVFRGTFPRSLVDGD